MDKTVCFVGESQKHSMQVLLRWPPEIETGDKGRKQQLFQSQMHQMTTGSGHYTYLTTFGGFQMVHSLYR